MSEFSSKLKKYIKDSNTNILKISNQSGLDYTTLHRMVNGKRLCRKQFLETLCQYLRINKIEEAELMELYYMEKLGKMRYFSRKEVRSLLIDISQKQSDLLRVKNKYMTVRNRNGSVQMKPDTMFFSTNTDIMSFLRIMTADEIRNQDSPEIIMDSFPNSIEVIHTICQEEQLTEKKIKCSQMGFFYRNENEAENAIGNIRLLHEILPFVFSNCCEYQFYYAYVNGSRKDQFFDLWPHYLMTSKGILLMSEEITNGFYMEDTKITAFYRERIKNLIPQYQPLFRYRNFGEGALQHYISEIAEHIPEICVNGCICVQWLLTDELVKKEKDNVILQQYRQYYTRLVQMSEEGKTAKRNCFFQTNGLQKFYETGILPEIYGKYLRTCTPDERDDMLRNLLNSDIDKIWNRYLWKDGDVSLEGLNFELFEQEQLALILITRPENFMIIGIQEAGIYEIFKDYFMGLIEDDLVYGLEEGREELKRRIQNLMKK